MTSYSLLICDDIRQETSGKLILIGYYPTDIVVEQFPAQLTLSLMLRIEDPPKGEHTFDMAMNPPEGAPSGVRGSFVGIPPQPGVLIGVGVPAVLLKAGDLVVTLTLDDQPPIEVGRIHVAQGAVRGLDSPVA